MTSVMRIDRAFVIFFSVSLRFERLRRSARHRGLPRDTAGRRSASAMATVAGAVVVGDRILTVFGHRRTHFLEQSTDAATLDRVQIRKAQRERQLVRWRWEGRRSSNNNPPCSSRNRRCCRRRSRLWRSGGPDWASAPPVEQIVEDQLGPPVVARVHQRFGEPDRHRHVARERVPAPSPESPAIPWSDRSPDTPGPMRRRTE